MTLADQSARARVPKPPFVFSVGVTGHRGLGAPEEPLRGMITEILDALHGAALRLHATESTVFAADPPVLRIISPLAEGTDQAVAELAIDAGYALHVVLPFVRAIYSADFADPGALARFDRLLGKASRIFELPCVRDEAGSGYALAGQAMIAHSDVVIAVWDGLPARGRGGTAEIVDQAVRRGVPVIHLSSSGDALPRLIWSLHDPHLTLSRTCELAEQPLDNPGYDRLLAYLVAPPTDAIDRGHLVGFLAEKQRRFRPRLGYPLLLALTGAQAIRWSTVWGPRFDDRASTDWRRFGDVGKPLLGNGNLDLGPVEASYSWSDGLATHLAQTHRSGHVFNFLAAALAVLLALAGLLAGEIKEWLAFAELAAIGALVLNTQVGVRRNWHRRWLDYRQLAERLRPMRSLALLGMAQPDRAGTRGRRRWIDWYAARAWRSIGLPSGRLTPDIGALAALVIATDVRPQIDYHRASAAAIRHLDHRLHQAGLALFVASFASCVVFILCYHIDYSWTKLNANIFVAISAGLPAIGTAIFGIRMQGDFAGTAARSQVTAEHLEALASTIKRDASVSRIADTAEAIARAMFGDLGEWRVSHQQRQLEMG